MSGTLEEQLQEILDIKTDIKNTLTDKGIETGDDFSTYASKINQIQGGSGSGSSFNLFDTKLADHILEGNEAKGWALQGSIVTKKDYPDFYERCLEEYNNSTLLDNIYTNDNGHKFYDISYKSTIDEQFEQTGMAWLYGIDQENECILLPRNIWFEQASLDNLEMIEAGLPNITGTVTSWNGNVNLGFGQSTGTFSVISVDSKTRAVTESDNNPAGQTGFSMDASKASSVYGNSDTVQPNAVKKLLYICVGNTVKDEAIIDLSKEIELNNPFSLGDSKYSPVALNNLSWLKSEGQWNSKAVYPSYYDWILTNVNNNKKGFVTNKMYGYAENNGAIFMLTTPTPQIGQPVYGYNTNIYLGVVEELVENGFVSTYFAGQNQYVTATVYRNSQYDQTGIIDDYHWCIDTENETFRLPLLDGSESLPGSRNIDLKNQMTKDTTIAFTAPGNGQYTFGVYSTAAGQIMNIHNVNSDRGISIQSGKSSGLIKANLEAKRGDLVHLSYNLGGNINNGVFKYNVGNGSLYYYVGETVQNANLINVGVIEEKIANLIPNNSELISSYGMPSSKYINLTLGANETTYTAPANGWYVVDKQTTGAQYLYCHNRSKGYAIEHQSPYSGAPLTILMPVLKGDVIQIGYNAGGNTRLFKFYYAEGSN